VATHAAKRVCADPICQTVLSIYNAADVCFLHEPRTHLTGSAAKR
jgi:hypothetical protein